MKITKKLAYLTITLQIAFFLIPISPVEAASSCPNCSQLMLSEGTARFPLISWEYKNVNGVLYRRLFNFTTNEPVTDREVCPTVP